MHVVDSEPQQSPSKRDSLNQSGTSVFLASLKTNGNFYIGLQSILDALDLWISSIKYYFDAINPGSNSLSSQMFWSWIHSEEGFCLFLLGAVLSAAFAYLGNGILDEDKTTFSKNANDYWPYIRDVIKRLKWTFKGMRSLLLVMQTLVQQNYIAYITPLGIGLGCLGAANQLWNRSMVEIRKSLQENNDRFRQQIKGIDACFLEVEEDWLFDKNSDEKTLHENLKHIYVGSIVKVKPKKPKAQPLYYQIYYNDGACKVEYKQIDTNKLSPNDKAFLEKLNEQLDIYRLPSNGGSSYPRITWNELTGLIANASKETRDSERSNENNTTETIDSEQVSKNSIFREVLLEKQTFIKNQIVSSNSTTHEVLFHQAKFQSNSREAFLSATLNGVLNAPYYFLGVLSMVVLPSCLFVPAVALCSVFMVLNVLSEIYQESDYQRRLKISQLKANLVMQKRLLMMEWQELNLMSNSLVQDIKNLSDLLELEHDQILSPIVKKYSEPKGGVSFEKSSLIDSNIVKDKNIPHLELLKALIRIENLERSFKNNYLELNSRLRLNTWYVSWQALRNGLVVYGAFNSLLMTISTMSFLFGFSITPTFFYISILVGSAMLLTTFLYTLFFIHPKQENSSDEDMGLHLNTAAPNVFVAQSTIEIIRSPMIQASENLLIPEHAEVFRQMLSGTKKGIKCAQTILPFFAPVSEHLHPMLFLTYLCVSGAYGFLFALKGLRVLMRADNKAYEKSFIYCALTCKKPGADVGFSTIKSIRDIKSLSFFVTKGEEQNMSPPGSARVSPLSIDGPIN